MKGKKPSVKATSVTVAKVFKFGLTSECWTPSILSTSMEGSVVKRTRPNPDRLPDDHCIDWLAEAKQRYLLDLPPFVERNQGSCRAGLRKNVTLRVTDEERQGLPVEAEIFCWSWSPQYTFGTIDIGGRRLIVKGDSSDRYHSYRSWLGIEKGFSHFPVAFGPWQKDIETYEWPSIDSKTQHANQAQTLSHPFGSRSHQTSMKNQWAPRLDWRPSNLSPTFPSSPSSARSAKTSPEYVARQQYAQGQQHSTLAEHTYQAASPSIKASPTSIQAQCRNVQVSAATIHHDSQSDVREPIERVPSSGPKIDGSHPEEHVEHPSVVPREGIQLSPSSGLSKACDRIREDHGPEERVEHPSIGPREGIQLSPSSSLSKGCGRIREDHGLNSKSTEDSAVGDPEQHDAPAEGIDETTISRQPGGKNPNAPLQYQGHDSTEPNPPARPTKRRRQTPTPNPTSPRLSATMLTPSAHSTPHPTPSTSSRFPTPTSTSTSPPLAPHKQSRTTLFVAIPLSTDTVPLKLRSCMTPSSLFAAVLAISAPAPGPVSGIRATFDWKRADEVDRAILVKLDVPDSFEVFLEIVDAAPCWAVEGGRCGVAVEVVLV